MITNVSMVDVWVKDIDESKAFYIEKLGFVAGDDVKMGDDFRWCTVGHPSQPELQVHLTTPGPPLSPDAIDAINRSLDEGGSFAIGLNVDDCKQTVADLETKGVEVLNPPESRPYGVEAVIRDNTGNWLVLVEQREWSEDEITEMYAADPSALDPSGDNR